MNDSVMPPGPTTPALMRPDPQARPGTLLALSHDVVARRAYEIYDRNDRQQGHCHQNWEQAERELREQSETDAGTIAVKDDRGATLWPGPHPVRSTRHAAIRMASARAEGAGAAIRLTQPRTER